MDKATSIRAHIESQVTQLKKNPDKLKIFIENGNVVARLSSLSFEYRYELQILVVDYEGHPDDLFLPIIAWVARNQPDLMQNPDKAENRLTFEAEPLNNKTYDIAIKMPLTEAVRVTIENNKHVMTHLEEPEMPDLTGPTPWDMDANGVPVNPPPAHE